MHTALSLEEGSELERPGVVQRCGRCRGPYGLLSCGLSFNTVSMPTRIASCIERILTCVRLNTVLGVSRSFPAYQ